MAHKKLWLWLAALLLVSAPAMAQTASDLNGDWDGTLTAPGGMKEHLALHVETHDGVTDATLIVIDEGNTKVAITAITRDGNSLSMDRANVPSFVKGMLTSDGNGIAGTMTRSSFPVEFTRRAVGAAAPAGPRRPQEPRPPFPYKSEDVTFAGPSGITLAGTLTMPQGVGPFPVVVLISGSGPQDRNETMVGHKPFLLIADTLTRRGIAVLRFDKRGVGKSTGDYANATIVDFAEDTEAAAAYLRARPDIDPKKIGLLGHSEGGTIAPMVAAKDPSIAFIVLMAGPGIKGEDLGPLQERLISQSLGLPPEAVEKNVAVARQIITAAKAATSTDDAKARITAVMVAAGMSAEQAAVPAAAQASPWFRASLDHDPVPTLRQVKCPVLAINGSLDVQMPPMEDLAGIKAALADNRDVTVEELPGLNHLFQTAKTGAMSEYGEIEETMSPVVLTLVGDWVVKHTQ